MLRNVEAQTWHFVYNARLPEKAWLLYDVRADVMALRYFIQSFRRGMFEAVR